MTDPLMTSNHLTTIRWVLASAVAIGHIWILTTGYEPFRIHQWTGSYMAVNGFFILSGMLIAKSLDMRRNLKSYAISRILRIYPAFIIILLAFVFFFSPFFSVPGGFENMSSAEIWKYVARVLFLGDPEGAPGGIFAGNLEPDFNGPLWTIRFELAAYVLAAAAFFSGLAGGLKRTAALFILVQVTYILLTTLVDQTVLPAFVAPLLRLSSAFLMGMALWHWPAARRPAWWIVIILLAIFAIVGSTSLGEMAANFALAALMMRFGLSKRTFRPLLKLPDYSYGIYIWHYPVMQVFIFLIPGLSPWGLMITSVPSFLILAALSWHIVERPALRLKPRPQKVQQPVFESSM